MQPGPTTEERVNVLLDEIKVPVPVQGAALTLGLQGLLLIALALQHLVFAGGRGIWGIAAVVLVVVGVAAAAIAVKLYRARAWAWGTALGLAVITVLGSGAWFVVMVLAGVISLLALATVGGALVTTLFVAVTGGAFNRVITARRRLREAGWDVDF